MLCQHLFPHYNTATLSVCLCKLKYIVNQNNTTYKNRLNYNTNLLDIPNSITKITSSALLYMTFIGWSLFTIHFECVINIDLLTNIGCHENNSWKRELLLICIHPSLSSHERSINRKRMLIH
jgi:hypothetical protein